MRSASAACWARRRSRRRFRLHGDSLGPATDRVFTIGSRREDIVASGQRQTQGNDKEVGISNKMKPGPSSHIKHYYRVLRSLVPMDCSSVNMVKIRRGLEDCQIQVQLALV